MTLDAPTRRRLMVAFGACCSVVAVPRSAWAQESALPRPASLPNAAAAAARLSEPLVVLVSLPGCPFCERIRRSHLLPLQRERGQGVVQLDLGTATPVIDFDGVQRSHDAVVRSWRVTMAPTMLMFDAAGAEIAERLVGAGLADFYAAYLDQRLQTARAVLARPMAPRS